MRRLLEWLKGLFSDEWSYRAESGVKVNVSGRGGRLSVDLDDPQTKEVFRKQLEKYAQYDVKSGRLVKRTGNRSEQ